MQQIIFTVQESVDGGYEATAVGHHIFTQGETWDDLKGMVQDAVRCHFADSDAPKIIRLLFTREEVLAA